jgi:hypothetical protein
MATIPELLDGHVTLEVECLDRLYLYGNIGKLVTGLGLVMFMREQLGKPVPSPSAPGNPVPQVINVDKNPAFPPAVEKLKTEGVLPHRVRLRQCKYLNNVVEQEHRTVKQRTWLAKGYGSFPTAWRTFARDRSGEPDSEGPGEVGAQTRSNSGRRLHQRVIRHRRLTLQVSLPLYPSPLRSPQQSSQ